MVAPETYQIANWQTGKRKLNGDKNFLDCRTACEHIKAWGLDANVWGVLGTRNLVDFIQATKAGDKLRAKMCLRFCS